MARNSAKAALVAIARWAEANPEGLLGGAAGVRRTYGNVRLQVCAPDAGDHVSTILGEVSSGQLRRANEVSLVFDVEFGKTCIVLGGDLPTTRGGGTVVPTGWRSVLQQFPELGSHTALKLPHHGSAGAYDPDLMTPGSGRAWLVTPFARQTLPRVFDGDGLPRLLEAQNEIWSTSIPSDVETEGLDEGAVSLENLTRRRLAPSRQDPFLDNAVDATPRQHRTATAPVWALALDDQGAIQRVWAGEWAVRICR